MPNVSKLITRKMTWHANMTQYNHLGYNAIVKPDKMLSKIDTLFTATRYSQNPFTGLLLKNNKVSWQNDRSWEWDLKGATTRPAVVLSKSETSTQPGRFNTEYRVVLDTDDFMPGDVMTPGATNKKYQSRIMSHPVRRGEGYEYIMQIVTNDPNLFIPTRYLEPGQKWGKLYSTYEEGSEQSGSTQYSSTIMLKNRMSLARKQYKVTGHVVNEVLAVKIPDSKGKLHDMWIKYAEAEYWQQWYRELERLAWYSRSTDVITGSTGFPVIMGPGIQEQLEDSHIHYYTHLTADLIQEFLMDIFYSRVKPGNGRKVVGYTGEYGMLLFHKAMQELVNTTSWFRSGGNFNPAKQVKSDYHTNAYALGYQFVEYSMPNGTTLKLVHNPLYDDTEINFEIDPITGKPVESMRITFLDFVNDKGEDNIVLKKKKNGFSLGYEAGLVSPYGPVNNGLMSHSGDWYQMHVKDEIGVHISDVTRAGELILARN